MGTKTLISVEDFDRLEEPEGVRYELDENELIEMSKPKPKHAFVQSDLFGAFWLYLRSNPVGRVVTGDVHFVLGPGTKRSPDIAFLTTDRVKQINLEKDIEGAPDLAVEIVSPSDSVAGLRRKIKQYFAAGARQVWVVYPDTAEIQVWLNPNQPQPMLQASDVLEAPDLLPGFSISVASLFQSIQP